MVKESVCNAGDLGSIPGSGRSPGEGKWQPTPVFLPGESHGQRTCRATVHGVARVGHDCTTNFPFLSFLSSQGTCVLHTKTRTHSFPSSWCVRAGPSPWGTSLGLPAALRVRSVPGTGLEITHRGGTEAPGRSCLERDACKTQPGAWNSLCELSILPRRVDS